MNWFDENLISVNTSKTKLVCFRNPLKKVALNVPLLLHISTCSNCVCSSLEYVNNVRYLGVLFDSDMSWNSHLAHVCGKLRSVSCLLYNQKVFMPFSVRKSIAHALGYSILRYGITLFGKCAESWQIKIDRVLGGLLKSVGYHLDSFADMNVFEFLRMPNFSSLFLESVVLRHFWNDEFKRPFVPSRSLRHTTRFVTPRCTTRYGKRVRSYYVPSIFNKLPDRFFESTTKRKLKKMLTNLSL